MPGPPSCGHSLLRSWPPGQHNEEAERIPKSYFTKRGRARRLILSRLELAVRVQAVFELFVGQLWGYAAKIEL